MSIFRILIFNFFTLLKYLNFKFAASAPKITLFKGEDLLITCNWWKNKQDKEEKVNSVKKIDSVYGQSVSPLFKEGNWRREGSP